ncbi:MAG TPA: hypothetical protein VJX67_00695 [Blastocatellia bacterium]|nr:hypothetical protein [Blastocatellia bacterium]
MNGNSSNVPSSGPARTQLLKDEIRDLGHEVDSYKTKTAAAMGGGVFLVLLATGGLYDVAVGNDSIGVSVGISQPVFGGIVTAFGVAGLIFLAVGVFRARRRDRGREARLASLEEELAQELAAEPTVVEGQ